MSRANLSILSFTSFDGKKLLVMMSIVVVTLTIDSQIGYIADFIPVQLSSSLGITTFIAIWTIFAVTQYYILAYVKKINKESRTKVRYLNLTHKIVTIAQFVLAGVIALVILQIFISQEYNTAILYAALSISYGLWIVTLGLLARAFSSWYKLAKKNLMVLILALSMIAYVINGVLNLYSYFDHLTQNNSLIRSGDVAVFPVFSIATLGDLITIASQTASSIAYVLTWIGTVMLLRPYIKKLGSMKFWTIMAAAMLYYIIQFPLFVLGYYNPSEGENAMTNILIFSMSAVFTGIIFGAAFLSVARTLKTGSIIRDYMIIAAYGFVLFYVSGSAMVSQAAYPPYGLAAVSFTGLSCYLIYTGLYFSAISVSQDIAVRKSIRKSVLEQSSLLDSIGSAQMERELQTRVLTVAKKASDIMAKETGVEAPMTEDDMKDYMEVVMKELQSKR
ncbi:MAG: hypothetical protein M3264_07875 [Thermoproteota archaeon]|nr:hypothetical protein [Thermoproteota archaeon]